MFVPENIRETMSRKAERLNERLHRIFEPDSDSDSEYKDALDYQDDSDDLEPREQETALNGYLSTHRINGLRGYDPTIYLQTIKNRVIRFWEEKLREGSWKIKTILTSKFHLKDQATGDKTNLCRTRLITNASNGQ